jgi:hypothetical protein
MHENVTIPLSRKAFQFTSTFSRSGEVSRRFFMAHIEVITCTCQKYQGEWGCEGKDLSRETFNDPAKAKAHALSARQTLHENVGKETFVVIIRPNFNEVHLGDQLFYREWRSFGGELFSEVHFTNCPSSQVRLDAEIILPEIP